MNKDDVSILFSGGSDSTLAAALMCKQFQKVHLLTLVHSGILRTKKSQINANRLKEVFGKDKVVHKFINIEEIFKTLYYGTYMRDLVQYGLYLAAGLCHTCQVAMHTATIKYNLENDIGFACDGYKREKSHIFVFMAKKGIKQTRDFYREFNIEYDNPVYDVLRTDWELFDMGIASQRNVKFPFERDTYSFSTQPHCTHGILLNAYLLGYHYYLHRRIDDQPPGIRYHKEKISVAKKYIHDQLHQRASSHGAGIR